MCEILYAILQNILYITINVYNIAYYNMTFFFFKNNFMYDIREKWLRHETLKKKKTGGERKEKKRERKEKEGKKENNTNIKKKKKIEF